MVFNILGMILAAMGFVTPSLAIVIMVLSIFAILANTLRIRGVDLKREDLVETETLADVELVVPSMVCEGCATKISTALGSLPGVREITPKVQQKHIYVQYEPAKVQRQQLKDAVRKAGFIVVAA